MNNSKLLFLIIIFFAIAGMFGKINYGDLPPLGSAAHAAVSREIIRTGDWLTLHWPYCPEFKDFYQFPPLHFWCTAIGYKLFGVSDFTAILSSALFGAGTILLTYWLGYLLFKNSFLAFISALFMATTPLLFKHSRKCELESILLFFTALSFIFFLLGKQKNEKYFILFGISTGLAFLSKGPPGYAPYGAVGLYIIITKQWQLLKNKYFWIGIISGLLVPFLWIIPQLLYEGDKLYNRYIQGQILWSIKGRQAAQKTLWEQVVKYMYFFPVMLIYYLPWGPLGFYGVYKLIKSKSQDMILMFCWIVTVWLGFTFAGWKDNYYMLLLYPAWVIGIVLIFKDWLLKEKIRRNITYTSIGILVSFIILLFTPVKLGKIRNPEFSDKQFVQAVSQAVPAEKAIIIYRLYYWDMISLFPWYIDRGVTNTVETPEELRKKFINSGSRDFCFMKTDEYESLPGAIKNKTRVFYKTGRYILLSNEAPGIGHSM